MNNYQLPVIQEMRAIKSGPELNNIIKAQRISEKVLKEALKKLKVGVTEASLAKFIVGRMASYGVKALAFEPTVSFGRNTANIHHGPGKAKLKQGNLVMLDFGATVNGYCSDMTRTFIFGRPTPKQIRVYKAVKQAQALAMNLLVKKERRAGVIDNKVRRFLTNKFGQACFNHGLGHGLGTAIHEWPNFKPDSQDVLKPGMVMTIEPGVYLKGWGGVRIEDIVVISQNGCRSLTEVPKDVKDIILRA